MNNTFIYVFLTLLLCSCTGDWKAKMELGCFMEGKLCYDYFNYSDSYEKYLILTLNENEYKVEVGGNWSNWISCQAVDNKSTLCSAQQLIIPFERLKRDCNGKLDILKFSKEYWQVKYYLVNLRINSNPPYSIEEVGNKYLVNNGFTKWKEKQLINEKQEILCP